MARWFNWRLMQLVMDAAVFRGTDNLIALVLASHADDEGRDAFPKRRTLARECGLDVATIKRRLPYLVATPYVCVQRAAGQHRPTTYAFDIGALRERLKVQPIQRAQPAPSQGVQPAPSQGVQRDAQGAQVVDSEGATCALSIEQNRNRTRTARAIRARVFSGKRLKVSEAQHRVMLESVGAAAEGVDWRARYAAWDQELVASGEAFDVLAYIKRRAGELAPSRPVVSDGTFVQAPCASCGFESLEGRYRNGEPRFDPCPRCHAGEDWFDECARLHGRSCNGRQGHAVRMGIEAERAARKVATA